MVHYIVKKYPRLFWLCVIGTRILLRFARKVPQPLLNTTKNQYNILTYTGSESKPKFVQPSCAKVLLQSLRDEEGMTVLIVEHDMELVMGCADYLFVLNFGKLLAQGTPAQVRSNPEVIDAYLGTDA